MSCYSGLLMVGCQRLAGHQAQTGEYQMAKSKLATVRGIMSEYAFQEDFNKIDDFDFGNVLVAQGNHSYSAVNGCFEFYKQHCKTNHIDIYMYEEAINYLNS